MASPLPGPGSVIPVLGIPGFIGIPGFGVGPVLPGIVIGGDTGGGPPSTFGAGPALGPALGRSIRSWVCATLCAFRCASFAASVGGALLLGPIGIINFSVVY